MITKEEFINLVNDHKAYNNRLDEVCNILGVGIYEADWIMYANVLFDKTINMLFNEDAVDDINWWLWEKAGRSDMKMWDSNGKEIPTETIEDLWELVKNNRK